MGHLVTLFQKNKIIAQDGFNRADNAASMGNANTGQTWIAGSGSVWGISANRAYTATTGISLEYMNLGISDVAVTSDIIFASGEGIIVRFTDASNYIVARMNSVGIALFKIVASAATSIGSFAFTPVSGTSYTVKLAARGPNLTVFLNGTQQITVSDAFNQTATLVGLRQSASPNGYFDYFIGEAAV